MSPSRSPPATAPPGRCCADVSLCVERGAFTSIVGAMGSGKSTLLSILAGLTAADSGAVTIDGEPVRGVRQDAAFVFQNYSLLPWFTRARERPPGRGGGVSGHRPRRGAGARPRGARAGRACPTPSAGGPVSCRAACVSGSRSPARSRPSRHVLFLDEPFGALDALTRETLQQDLLRLCSSAERPVTTVMITNSVEEAILLSDRIVPMLPGPPATLGAADPGGAAASSQRRAARARRDGHPGPGPRGGRR